MPGFGGRWVRYAVGVVAFGVVALAWHYGARQAGEIVPVAQRSEPRQGGMGGLWPPPPLLAPGVASLGMCPSSS